MGHWKILLGTSTVLILDNRSEDWAVFGCGERPDLDVEDDGVAILVVLQTAALSFEWVRM